MYRIYFITFGCKVNQYESECIKSEFEKRGFLPVDEPKSADVIVINSCTVTASGDSKSLYALRKLRKEAPDAVIVFTGCLPQSTPDNNNVYSDADIVTGTKNRGIIPRLVEDFMQNREKHVHIEKYGCCDEFEDMTCTGYDDHTRAFVKIQDGCNQFCSYCIIPYSRGRCRSKSPEVLSEELSRLAQSGYKEVVLVGINLAFYGKEYGLRLADAVELASRTKGIQRVRLGSLEPEMISDDDLFRLSAIPQFCPQFHLSLQSGCTKTLKAMNRKYTAEEYYELVCRIRRAFPEASFTTDIMVGFPGETDGDFEESLRFAEKVGFSRIHVFQYSPRKGTPAAEMKQVSPSVKRERAERMKSLGAELTRRYLSSLIGKTVPVLLERENCTEFHHGYAPDYTLIKIKKENYKKCLRNMIFCVKIEESESDCCIGSLADSFCK